MRDFRDAKAVAQTLRDELKAKGVCLTHSDNLELAWISTATDSTNDRLTQGIHSTQEFLAMR
jgi:hypothetical protein